MNANWFWSGSKTRSVAVAVLLLVLGAMAGSTFLRAKSARKSFDASMTLAHASENLPTNAWKAIPLTVAYSGVLSVDVGVARGNPLNVFVATPEQMHAIDGDDVATVHPYPGFGSMNAISFQREGRIAAGKYYLVLQDPANGSVSDVTSDVSIHVTLRP